MRTPPGLSRAFGLLILLAGCPPPTATPTTESDGSDATGGTSGDGPTTGGTTTTATTEATPTTGGEPEFAGVVAPVLRTYRPLVGEEVVAPRDPLPDLESLTIVAVGQTYPAVYDGSTRLEFAGVPDSVYQLRAQSPAEPELPDLPGPLMVTASEARELEIYAGIFGGRPDVAFTEALATALSVSVTDMLPLAPEDQFEFFSYNADALLLQFPNLDEMDATGSPQLDDTEIVGWQIPWRPGSGRGGWPLVDTGEGDDFWLGHLAASPLVPAPAGVELQDPWSYAQRYVLAETAKLSLPTMTSGATTTVTGAFKPVAGETVAIDVRAGEFMAELDVYDATLKSVGCFVAAVLEPGTDHPIHGVTPNLGGINVYGKDVPVDPSCLDMDCETMFATPGDRVLELAVGNPYAGGTETLVVQCSRYVFVEDPDGGDYDYLAADMIVQGKLADLAQAPIVPKIGLVRDLAVNGVAVAPDTALADVGLNPVISFTAPKFGAPDFYTITIRTIDDVAGADGLVERRALGSIRTEFTQVTIPDGYLEPGGHYYVQVTAERSRLLAEAHGDSHDVYLSRAMTGIITP